MLQAFLADCWQQILAYLKGAKYLYRLVITSLGHDNNVLKWDIKMGKSLDNNPSISQIGSLLLQLYPYHD
jgi:hypothetical protein